MSNPWFLFLLGVLFALDAIVTGYLLTHVKTAREQNPVVVWFIENFGLRVGLFIAKAGIFALVVRILDHISTPTRVVIVAVYVVVVAWNLYLLRRARQSTQ